MIISNTTISPLSPKRSGVGATPLISTMKHEWYFNNVQNASTDIITIPDTGSVGGLDIANPALANKPTASTIGTKISYAADGVDDYLYKAKTNFMRSMPTWMVTVVFKFDSSKSNRFLSAWNEANTVNEGFSLSYNTSLNKFQTTVWNINGTVNNTTSNVQALVNGQNYIFTFSWDGTNVVFYLETTGIGSTAKANPLLQPSSTNNISTTSIIRPSHPSGDIFEAGNIGYIGIDEFDLTRLNNNVATLKSTFGIL